MDAILFESDHIRVVWKAQAFLVYFALRHDGWHEIGRKPLPNRRES